MIIGLGIFTFLEVEQRNHRKEEQELVNLFEQMGQTELLEELHQDESDTLMIPANEVTEIKKWPETLKDASGIIRMPAIDLEMVLFKGATTANLAKGAAIINSAKNFGVDNVGIAGHRGWEHGKQFNRLDELVIGDKIEVLTKKEVFQFEVVDIFIVHKSEVSVLNDIDIPLITLITCTPVGKKNPPDRLIIQAKWNQF